jgi:hypothetical protein
MPLTWYWDGTRSTRRQIYYFGGGPGTEYRVTFPPYSQTTRQLADGAPTVYIYEYDYTKSPYNYGYKYTNTTTYTNFPTATDVTGVNAYWSQRVSAPVAAFKASHDPSGYSDGGTTVSYLYNADVFDQAGLTIQNISDGSSNTVLMAEGYSYCYGYDANWNYGYRYATYNPSRGDYSYSYSYSYEYTNGSKYSYTGGYTYNNTPSFRQVAGKTFQTRPSPNAYYGANSCDASVPQGLSSGVLMALLGDGSVKSVSAGISPSTWGGALSPNGGEVLGNGW